MTLLILTFFVYSTNVFGRLWTCESVFRVVKLAIGICFIWLYGQWLIIEDSFQRCDLKGWQNRRDSRVVGWTWTNHDGTSRHSSDDWSILRGSQITDRQWSQTDVFTRQKSLLLNTGCNSFVINSDVTYRLGVTYAPFHLPLRPSDYLCFFACGAIIKWMLSLSVGSIPPISKLGLIIFMF